MAALQLTVGGILFMLTTVAAVSQPRDVDEEPSAGCLELVVAGMAAYDMYVDLSPQGAIESTNAQLPIDLDLTDRSAVESFLCDLASINGLGELSECIGVPESMLRNWYQMMQQGMSAYIGGEGEEGVRDILRLHAIWSDVVDFASQVGFNPHYPHGHGPEGSSSSSEEQEQVVVEPAHARSFIDGMVAEYGEEFASDVFTFLGKMGGMGPTEPVNVDPEDLYTAIVESKTNAEFARAINVPERLVTDLFFGITRMSSEIYPNAGYTMMDIMEVEMNLASVLLDLGFFSWE